MKKRRKAKLGEVMHRWLVPIAGGLFLVAGGAKLISVFGDATMLKVAGFGVALAVAAFDGHCRHCGSGCWIAGRVGEGSSFSGAVAAVLIERWSGIPRRREEEE